MGLKSENEMEWEFAEFFETFFQVRFWAVTRGKYGRDDARGVLRSPGLHGELSRGRGAGMLRTGKGGFNKAGAGWVKCQVNSDRVSISPFPRRGRLCLPS